MEEDNNAREELLAQINQKHNKLALKTIKVEELEKSVANLTEEKNQLEERQSEFEKENKQILKAFCKLELQLKEAKEGGLGEIGNLMKKNKSLEFEVERFKAVKLKNDMKIQMLEQKNKSCDEAKKQVELDLKNDDCKKKELIDKTRKVNNCFVIYIQISHTVRFDSNFPPHTPFGAADVLADGHFNTGMFRHGEFLARGIFGTRNFRHLNISAQGYFGT